MKQQLSNFIMIKNYILRHLILSIMISSLYACAPFHRFNDSAYLERYIEKYPDSEHIPAVRNRLAVLKNPIQLKRQELQKKTKKDRHDWEKAIAAKTVLSYWVYLKEHPDGDYASVAKKKILEAPKNENSNDLTAVQIAEIKSVIESEGFLLNHSDNLDTTTANGIIYKNTLVLRAKIKLAKLGFAVSNNDQVDANSRLTIRSFQKNEALPITGEATPELLSFLKQSTQPAQLNTMTFKQSAVGANNGFQRQSSKKNSSIKCKTFIGITNNGKVKQVGGCPSRADRKQIRKHLKQVVNQRELIQQGEYKIVETKI